jgi:hypothetical protein
MLRQDASCAAGDLMLAPNLLDLGSSKAANGAMGGARSSHAPRLH